MSRGPKKKSIKQAVFSPNFVRTALRIQNKNLKAASRIWTDSRSIQAGDLFAAIPGEKFDGHAFVKAAAKQGAVGAVVTKKNCLQHAVDPRDLPKHFALLYVKDTTEALRALAKAHRRRLNSTVISVAGSNGKTTTKEWVAHLLTALHDQAEVFKTKKSQNSILGIALSLLQIRDEKFSVIEIGIDEPGWMKKHLEIVAPDFGVITNIGEEHLNRLKNIETVAKEELKLLGHLKKNKKAFAANLDSPWIEKEKYPAAHLTYGLDHAADIEGRFTPPNVLHCFGHKFMNPLPGRHNAQNLLAALAMIRLVMPELSAVQLKTLVHAAKTFEGEAHRSRWITASKDIRIFDDCYNANPESMEKSLQTFAEISSGCHQRVVLGDMLDLGDNSEEAHRRILNLVSVMGFDQIYLLGPHFSKALRQAKAPFQNVKAFEAMPSLEETLKKDVNPADTVFLKGSRGMALEKLLPIFTEV